ncbi:flagellar motor protein MotB [candidate division KSB1 bacterium]
MKAIGSLRGALGIFPHDPSTFEPQIVPIPQLSNLAEADVSESLVEAIEVTSETDISEIIRMEKDEKGLHFTLGDSFLFESGSKRLRDDENMRDGLRYIANLATGWPNRMVIVGHTDNAPVTPTPEFVDNLDLSYGRAKEVARFFNFQEGIPFQNMEVVPRGEYDPIATNDTPEGRARNRRVEIFIIYKRETKLPEKVVAELAKIRGIK